MIEAEASERSRRAGVEIGRDYEPPVAELAKVVAATRGRKEAVRKRSSARWSNKPVGIARLRSALRAAIDSTTLRRSAFRILASAAPTNRRGSDKPRRANSPSAGRRKSAGDNDASAPSSMNSRYIWDGEMPFASAAATKPPDETPA